APAGRRPSTCRGPVRQAAGSLYTRPRFSILSEVTSSPSLFFSAPAIAPRIRCETPDHLAILCRVLIDAEGFGRIILQGALAYFPRHRTVRLSPVRSLRSL